MSKKLTACAAGLVAACMSLTAAASVFPVAITNVAACDPAPAHTTASFCEGFKATVYCNCHAQHGPDGMCHNPAAIYAVEKVQYGRYGKDWLMHMCEDKKGDGVSVAECMDQWTCFMTGKPFDPSHGACGQPKC